MPKAARPTTGRIEPAIRGCNGDDRQMGRSWLSRFKSRQAPATFRVLFRRTQLEPRSGVATLLYDRRFVIAWSVRQKASALRSFETRISPYARSPAIARVQDFEMARLFRFLRSARTIRERIGLVECRMIEPTSVRATEFGGRITLGKHCHMLTCDAHGAQRSRDRRKDSGRSQNGRRRGCRNRRGRNARPSCPWHLRQRACARHSVARTT